jgi:hypothetical protein
VGFVLSRPSVENANLKTFRAKNKYILFFFLYFL